MRTRDSLCLHQNSPSKNRIDQSLQRTISDQIFDAEDTYLINILLGLESANHPSMYFSMFPGWGAMAFQGKKFFHYFSIYSPYSQHFILERQYFQGKLSILRIHSPYNYSPNVVQLGQDD